MEAKSVKKSVLGKKIQKKLIEKFDSTKRLESYRIEKKNKKEGFRSIWHYLISELLHSSSLRIESTIGYYKIFRILPGPTEDPVEHITEKVQLDILNEKRFRLDFPSLIPFRKHYAQIIKEKRENLEANNPFN